MLTLNLVVDPWLPVLRRSGSRSVIAPWQITDGFGDDPIMALTLPRADLSLAVTELLIGLLQTLAAPEDADTWFDVLAAPPAPEQLRERFGRHADAFELGGAGPRFMQDLDATLEQQADKRPIDALLINAPGEQALKQNTDLFVKRGQVAGLSPALAAATLYTLQAYAPAGGQGHRTSLRGGGPLTTLVVGDAQAGAASLWENLWLNVLPAADFLGDWRGGHAAEDLFAWMCPTRTSEKGTGGVRTPEDTHPAHVYWGMPRRIRLCLDEADLAVGEGHCDLSGEPCALRITHFVTRNYGNNYTGAWRHPLSSYYRTASGEMLPRHPQPGGIGYRHWLALAAAPGSMASGDPAKVVDRFIRERDPGEQRRLRAAGYDMDNMAARGWYDAELPVYGFRGMQPQPFHEHIQQLIEGAEFVAQVLRAAAKTAWFGGATVRGDLSHIERQFWERTEAAFYRELDEAASSSAAQTFDAQYRDQSRVRWHRVITEVALAIFDQQIADGLIDAAPRRVALAQGELRGKLFGGKLRDKILTLPKPPKNGAAAQRGQAEEERA